MKPAPDTIEAVQAMLRSAHAKGEPVGDLDLRRLNRVIEYCPEDMTVTVEAGISLGSLQALLAEHQQWLPVDPPFPGKTMGGLLAVNASGPNRLAHGTLREHLLGLSAVLADGRLISGGGRVVKNVAGYDTPKMFVGSRGTLGLIVSATFKLRPLPSCHRLFAESHPATGSARETLERLAVAPLAPVSLDLVRGRVGGGVSLRVGLAGTVEEVAWQEERLLRLGTFAVSDGREEEKFWEEGAGVRTESVPRSRLAEALEKLGENPFVARAGNGVFYHRSGTRFAQPNLPVDLLRRLKAEFDPKSIFPECPW